MRRLIAAQGLEKHFVFTGFCSDIPELLSSMDVLAFLPQAAEGFGRPLIEAMAMCRPIVATDIGPSREILGDRAGLLIPPGNAATLANALIKLLNDENTRNIMGQAGRNRVESLFTMEKHTRAIEAIYQQVLG